MRFRVTLDRRRKGISRYYEVVVRADDAADAARRASLRRRGMTVVGVSRMDEPITVESKGDE